MSSDPSILKSTSGSWCLGQVASMREITGNAFRWVNAGMTVRFLRGRKMETYEALFDECAAALQFPWYFGENGNAFDECMSDLSWLPPKAGYLFIVTDPGRVLQRIADDGLSWLVGSLGRAAAVWSRPVSEGQPWDRPAIPFHVLLQAEGRADLAVERWRTSTAEVTWIEE